MTHNEQTLPPKLQLLPIAKWQCLNDTVIETVNIHTIFKNNYVTNIALPKHKTQAYHEH